MPSSPFEANVRPWSTPLSKPPIPANSGRKRANAIPSLHRPLPSPSHAVEMAQIWHYAALSLERSNIATTPRPAFRTLEQKQDFPLSQWGRRYGPCGDDTRDMLSFGGDHEPGTVATPLESRRGQVFATPKQYPLISSGDQSLQLSSSGSGGTSDPAWQEGHQDEVQYPVLETASVRDERKPLLEAQWPKAHRSPLKTLMTRPLEPDEMDDDDECHSSHGTPFIMPFACSTGFLQPTCQKEHIDFWIDDVISQSERHPALIPSQKQLALTQQCTESEKPILPPKSRPLPKIPASSPFATPAKRGTSAPKRTNLNRNLSKSPLRDISGTSSNKENIKPSATPSPHKIPCPNSGPSIRCMPGSSPTPPPLPARSNGLDLRTHSIYEGKGRSVPTTPNLTEITSKQRGSPSLKVPNARKLVHTMMRAGASPKTVSPRTPTRDQEPLQSGHEYHLKDLSPLVQIQRKGRRAGVKH